MENNPNVSCRWELYWKFPSGREEVIDRSTTDFKSVAEAVHDVKQAQIHHQDTPSCVGNTRTRIIFVFDL